MFREVLALILLACALGSEETKSSKRSLRSFGSPSWFSLQGNPWASHYLWQPLPLTHGSLYAFLISYPDKSHFSLKASSAHDITAAALAHKKIQAAREQFIIQEGVTAAKKAASIQTNQALTAGVHKSKSSSTSSTSVFGGNADDHFFSGPWLPKKSSFSHWDRLQL